MRTTKWKSIHKDGREFVADAIDYSNALKMVPTEIDRKDIHGVQMACANCGKFSHYHWCSRTCAIAQGKDCGAL